jgi:hypothetical protein
MIPVESQALTKAKDALAVFGAASTTKQLSLDRAAPEKVPKRSARDTTAHTDFPSFLSKISPNKHNTSRCKIQIDIAIDSLPPLPYLLYIQSVSLPPIKDPIRPPIPKHIITSPIPPSDNLKEDSGNHKEVTMLAALV